MPQQSTSMRGNILDRQGYGTGWNGCWAADTDLNANYQKARGAMREMDKMLEGDLAGAEITLRDAQRLWIKYRDAACDAEGFTVRGGTMEGLVVTICLERLTRQRSDELRRLFELN